MRLNGISAAVELQLQIVETAVEQRPFPQLGHQGVDALLRSATVQSIPLIGEQERALGQRSGSLCSGSFSSRKSGSGTN